MPPISHGPSGPERLLKASQFKAQCLELMDEVKTRRIEVIITKRGAPVAKLVPVDDLDADPFGFLKGTVLDEDDIVSPDPDVWSPAPTDPLERPARSTKRRR